MHSQKYMNKIPFAIHIFSFSTSPQQSYLQLNKTSTAVLGLLSAQREQTYITICSILYTRKWSVSACILHRVRNYTRSLQSNHFTEEEVVANPAHRPDLHILVLSRPRPLLGYMKKEELLLLVVEGWSCFSPANRIHALPQKEARPCLMTLQFWVVVLMVERNIPTRYLHGGITQTYPPHTMGKGMYKLISPRGAHTDISHPIQTKT